MHRVQYSLLNNNNNNNNGESPWRESPRRDYRSINSGRIKLMSYSVQYDLSCERSRSYHEQNYWIVWHSKILYSYHSRPSLILVLNKITHLTQSHGLTLLHRGHLQIRSYTLTCLIDPHFGRERTALKCTVTDNPPRIHRDCLNPANNRPEKG
jgi:hypothetical protein